MGEIKIVNIEAKPWWKFWTTDNLQVTVEDEQGKQKTFTIYTLSGFLYSEKITRASVKSGIAEKYCTGDQYWSLPQIENHTKKLEKTKTKIKKISNEVLLNELLKLIGSSFDCALVLSKEAED